jgi:hypothetical protein
MCAYSDGYTPSETTQTRAISLDQERLSIQKDLEYTLTNSVQVLKTIQDSPVEHASDKINAVKTGAQIMGFNAPQTINTNNKSLFVELQGLTIDQLKTLEKLSIDNENM